MKKSNKLLVAGFLAVVLLISAIHITLYAKYKRGDYTIYNSKEELAPQAMQSFPNILVVSVRNVHNATAVFSDVAKVEKEGEEDVRYDRKGDTLLITGKSDAIGGDFSPRIVFHLPYNSMLNVTNSSLSFEAEKTNVDNSPVIHLQKSAVVFSGDASPLRFGNLKAVASDNSAIMFRGNTNVAHLETHLSNSAFEFMDGNLGELTIETDSVSRLSLQSKYLSKANIKITK